MANPYMNIVSSEHIIELPDDLSSDNQNSYRDKIYKEVQTVLEELRQNLLCALHSIVDLKNSNVTLPDGLLRYAVRLQQMIQLVYKFSVEIKDYMAEEEYLEQEALRAAETSASFLREEAEFQAAERRRQGREASDQRAESDAQSVSSGSHGTRNIGGHSETSLECHHRSITEMCNTNNDDEETLISIYSHFEKVLSNLASMKSESMRRYESKEKQNSTQLFSEKNRRPLLKKSMPNKNNIGQNTYAWENSVL